jgi:hypothetical protein
MNFSATSKDDEFLNLRTWKVIAKIKRNSKSVGSTFKKSKKSSMNVQRKSCNLIILNYISFDYAVFLSKK